MRVTFSNYSLPANKGNNVVFKAKEAYEPTAAYTHPEYNNLFKSIVHGMMVSPHPEFRKDDEIRFMLWENAYDTENAVAERKNWENWSDKIEAEELQERQRIYRGDSVIYKSEHSFVRKTFQDGSSIMSNYSENSPNGLPVIEFEWKSKPDSLTEHSPEMTRIRFNLNGDKRLNITSEYYRKFYHNYGFKGREIVKQSASINPENGKIKTKLNMQEQSELKTQVKNILSLAQAANVNLPYNELHEQIDLLGKNPY